MGLTIREATTNDVECLAQMNNQLIEDEGSRNPMNMAQLAERMRSILSGEWKVLIIGEENEDIGYMVYKISPDEYFPYKNELHIRQYFVKRSYRGKGIGAEAFETISRDYFPADTTLTLDVLEVNPGGRRFWEKVGFQPYLTHMKKGV